MPDTFAIGRLTLEPFRELRAGADPIPLGGRGLDILSVLARAGGKVVTKAELMERVWQGAIVEDNALQAQVSQLRKLMGPDGARLVAVHGRGYRLTTEGSGEVRAAPPPAASVAVLPFSNLTGDPAKAYLADGLAEEVILTLSRSRALKVPARTSSFAYRERDCDVRQIAQELGVANVLEGSVRAAGERIRVTAQLVEAESGFHLWGRNYDREFGDLFALQDEIAGEIATALKSELGIESENEPDFEAYHMFLQARAIMGTQNRTNLRLALDLLDKAIERDPNYARFHASRGFCRHLCTMFGLLDASARVDIEKDTETAIALDPALPWTYSLKAILRSSRADWVGAHETFSIGMVLDESEPEGLNGFGLQGCAPLGLIGRGFDLCERSRNLAPAVPITHALLAMLHSVRGDYDRADASVTMALNLGFPATTQPVSPVIAQLAIERGDAEAATKALADSFPQLAVDLGSTEIAAAVYAALTGKGDRQLASDLAHGLLERICASKSWPAFNVMHVWLLDWQVRLGNLDRAFAVADEHVDQFRRHEFITMVSLLPIWNPWMRPFREDPRFQDYVRAFNMFEFWEKHGPPDGHELRGGRLVCL